MDIIIVSARVFGQEIGEVVPLLYCIEISIRINVIAISDLIA